jgi:tetraacyldisaccharide 4'-kinase
LARDLDVVVMPDRYPAPRLLPAGPFREPTRALRRAGAIVVFGGHGAAACAGAPLALRARTVPEAVVRVEQGRWLAEPVSALAGRDVVVVTGIARPERVSTMVVAVGATLRRVVRRPDHHPWSADEVKGILDEAGDALVVTTEKDLVKWTDVPSPSVRALRLGVEVEEAEKLVGLAAGADVLFEGSAR